jgi:hypothetical protein
MKLKLCALSILLGALNAFSSYSSENNAPIIKIASSAAGFTFLKTTNANLISKCGGSSGWLQLPNNQITATVLTQLSQGRPINSITVETGAPALAISEGGIGTYSTCRVEWIEFSLP